MCNFGSQLGQNFPFDPKEVISDFFLLIVPYYGAKKPLDRILRYKLA